MRSATRTNERWQHIEYLLRDRGEITMGSVGSIQCAAVAADSDQSLAMLVRRPGESLDDLLTRLDEAIRKAMEEDEFTDEINP